MNLAWSLALIITGGFYVGLVGTAFIGLLRLSRKSQPAGSSRSVSVIIAARDEEAWIEKTLRSIIRQERALEVIVVADRCQDGTADAVRSIAQDHPEVKLIEQSDLPAGMAPKKAALQKGIAAASGELIVLTDADCEHPEGWIEALTATLTARSFDQTAKDGYGDPSSCSPVGGMAIGQARFDIGSHPPFWQRLQALDFAAQGCLAAGLAAAGVPFNCSGASLAFDKASFEKVGGWGDYQGLISGDDELLMARSRQAGLPVKVAVGREAVVATRPPQTLAELWHQRVRWGSKGLHYSASRKVVLSGVFLFYLLLILSLPAAAVGLSLLIPAIAMAIKLLLDGAVLACGRALYGDRVNPVAFIVAEILHPPIIVAMAIGGAFGSFRWKGERYTAVAIPSSTGSDL